MEKIFFEDIKLEILEDANKKDVEIAVKQEQRSDELIHHQERIDDIDVRDQLLTSLIRKDNIIERLLSEQQILETQLQSAVTEKCDALARLEKIEGKEIELSFKENQTEIEKEQLNNQIKLLTDNLNKNVINLIAGQHEHSSAVAQQEIELKQKTEELRLANLKICELTESSQLLKSQNNENLLTLKEQLRESAKMMENYENELKAKIDLTVLYKGNSDDHDAHINELTDAVTELKQIVNESVAECGRLETELKGCKVQHSHELDAKDEIIKQLKEELEHANRILKENNNDEPELEHYPPTDVAYRHLKKGMTLTEIYTQYYSVVKELQNKEKDYNILETEMKNSIEEWKEGSRQFYIQLLDLKNLKTANEKLTEEMKIFKMEKVIARDELQNARFECKILKDENNRLKFYQMGYKNNFFQNPSTEHIQLKTDDAAFAESLKESHTINDTIQLKEQNQQLLHLLHNLFNEIHEIEVIQGKLNKKSNETILANENLLANSLEANAELEKVILEISNSHRNVNDRHTSVDTRSVFVQTQNSNYSKMEEILRNKTKELHDLKKVCDGLQVEVRKLTAEKYKLSAEASLFSQQMKNLQNNVQTCQQRIETLEKHNESYLTTINKQKDVNKHLTDENVSVIRKLSDVQSSCDHFQNECRKLLDIKNTLENEVKTLKLELDKTRISNKMLTHKLKILTKPSEQIETDKSQSENLQNEQESTENFVKEVQIKSESLDFDNHQEMTCQLDTPSTTIADAGLQSQLLSRKHQPTSSLQVRRRWNNSKRSQSTETNYSMTLRSKKPRVTFRDDTKFIDRDRPTGTVAVRSSSRSFGSTKFVDAENENDECNEDIDVNVCDDTEEELSNLQFTDLQYAARTRRECQFLHDALQSEEAANNDSDENQPNARVHRKIIGSRGRSRGVKKTNLGQHNNELNSGHGYRLRRGGISRGRGERGRPRRPGYVGQTGSR